MQAKPARVNRGQQMTKADLEAAFEMPIANHGFISAKYQSLSLPTLNYSDHESSIKLSMGENEA